MLSFIGQSLLEGLVDIGLNVVLVELGLALLVLRKVVAHVFVKALLLLVQVRLHTVIVPLTLVVLSLDFTELVAQSS